MTSLGITSCIICIARSSKNVACAVVHLADPQLRFWTFWKSPEFPRLEPLIGHHIVSWSIYTYEYIWYIWIHMYIYIITYHISHIAFDSRLDLDSIVQYHTVHFSSFFCNISHRNISQFQQAASADGRAFKVANWGRSYYSAPWHLRRKAHIHRSRRELKWRFIWTV